METVTVHTEEDIIFSLIHGQYELTMSLLCFAKYF